MVENARADTNTMYLDLYYLPKVLLQILFIVQKSYLSQASVSYDYLIKDSI